MINIFKHTHCNISSAINGNTLNLHMYLESRRALPIGSIINIQPHQISVKLENYDLAGWITCELMLFLKEELSSEKRVIAIESSHL